MQDSIEAGVTLLVHWPLSLLLSDKEITVFHMGLTFMLKNPKHEQVSQQVLGEIEDVLEWYPIYGKKGIKCHLCDAYSKL